MFSTPCGTPASSASSPRREAVSGDSSLIFSTAVLPNARHGAIFQVAGHERHVPRPDQRAHAHRVEQRVVQVRRRRVGVAVDARAHLGEVVEVVGRARHQLLAGLRDRPGRCPRLGARESRARAWRSGRRACASASRARLAGRAAQAGERGLGRGDGGVDLVVAAGGHLGQHLLRGRVDRLEDRRGCRPACRRSGAGCACAWFLPVRFNARTPRRRRWC